MVEKIPEILSYIVYGYIYLTAYYWVSFKENESFKNLLIKSAAVNFILITLFDVFFNFVGLTFNNAYYVVIIYFMLSALIGLVIGKIVTHRWFNGLLHKLHIGRTTNKNIWDDVIKPHTWVRVFTKDGCSYLGQYRFGEPFKSEPIVVLATYQLLDQDSNVVIDLSHSTNELIMLNTKDFEKIEIIYDK